MMRMSVLGRVLILVSVVVLCLGGFIGQAKESFLVLQIKGKGELRIKLFTDKAPKTTARIKELATAKFYDNQKFFKVVRQPRPFLAQFGDPLTKTAALTDEKIGTGGSGQKIPFEDTGLHHGPGMDGLSRMPEDPNSGDCQFYVMLGEAGFLDGKYCVFGQVTEGLELLKKLELGDVVTTARISER